MTAVVVASNILVQYPVQGQVGPLVLSDLLTWGAFTYPVAFLVTDLTNRCYGPATARLVVVAGFAVAVALSVALSTPRIAAASGSAFLFGQILDVTVFNRLRRLAWWWAPLTASLVGSVLDTAIFFSLAFAPFAAFLGANDDFAIAHAPLLGIFAPELPRFVSWALGDLSVKILAALVLLAPYRVVLGYVLPEAVAPRQAA
ncbi:VUT family protein [Pseudoxanthobacter sp.]|uniref:VUT family protein n=1 Tax=Pseudoxanthobacter sp. TaxID=1925742 RepID=UPI002FE03B46